MDSDVEGTTNRKERAGRRRAAWGVVLGALILGGTCMAQSGDTGPAARAVRLSYVSGQVQIAQGGQAITTQAAANMPLFEGYQVTTGQDGQAEIQFEDGSVARIAPDSGLTLSVLRGQGANGSAVIQLNGGLAYFELQGSYQAGQIQVQFGDAAVTAGGFTVMRVDMDTPPGTLAVFSGNAHLTEGEAMAVDLHGGESVTLNANDPSQYNLAESVEPNSWDQWNNDRDQALEATANDQTPATDSFVNTENPAWNDLNANGNWYDVPDQGYVWSPYVAANAGWDPYGCGQWVWTPGYGYIWVSCYAWGYMPYQCGLWNYYDSFGWGWAPGACNPWWGAGYIGPNIGFAPRGYHPILRPHLVQRPVPKGPRPVIVVNREPAGGYSGPPRARTGPVVIAGHTVEPLQPVPARTMLGGSAPNYPIRQQFNPPARTPNVPARTTMPVERRGYVPAPRTAPEETFRGADRNFTQPTRNEPSRNYSQPSHNYSQPRNESAPSRGTSGGGHPSGGGGGGGSHGGGGGGGGGSHSSSGGGHH